MLSMWHSFETLYYVLEDWHIRHLRVAETQGNLSMSDCRQIILDCGSGESRLKKECYKASKVRLRNREWLTDLVSLTE